jgi:hypothetical protein
VRFGSDDLERKTGVALITGRETARQQATELLKETMMGRG